MRCVSVSATYCDKPNISSSQESLNQITDCDASLESVQGKMDQIEKALREGKMDLSTSVILTMFNKLQQSILSIKSELKMEIKDDLHIQQNQQLQEMEVSSHNEIDSISDAFDRIEVQEDDLGVTLCHTAT